MLVYKASQVVACVKEEPKSWTFQGREGVVHSAKLSVLGTDGGVASIRLKGKTAEELAAKISRVPIGKSAEIPILEVIPVFRSGDRKASGYEFAA